MATNISWPPIGGSAHSIPAAGEVGWPALSNFLIALKDAQGTAAQKTAVRTATSSPVTVGNTDCVVRVALTVPGAVAVTLPTGVTGQYFTIVDGTGDAATNNITIAGTGGQTINGDASFSLNHDYGAVVLSFTNAGNWSVIGAFSTSDGAATIARNTIAAATAGYVLINDGSGMVSEEQYLNQTRGGMGANVSALTGVVKSSSGTFSAGYLVNADVDANAAIDASKIHDGTVTNTEFKYLDGVTGPIQTAIDAKLPLAGGTLSGFLTLNADPSSNLHAATKAYVDSVAAGLKVRGSVYAAATGNVVLSGEQTIDGQACVSGDRVLLMNQTLPQENGIYSVAVGAWTRTTDTNTWNKLVSAFAFVEQGSAYADTGWVCTVNNGGTLGVTAVTWVQFSSAGSYAAGNGLQLSGTSFSVKSNGTDTIQVDGSGVKVKDAAIFQTPKIAVYQEFAPVADQTAPGTGMRIWASADGKIRKIAAGESIASVLGGGLITELKSSAFTAAAGMHYLCNTTSGAYSVTLPAGVAGAVIRFSDDARTWGTNNLTLTPSSGQSIGSLLANETLVCDITGAHVQLMWDATRWVVDTNGFAASITSGSLSSAIGMGAKNYISNPNNATNWTSSNATNVAVSTETTAANLPNGYTQTGCIKILRAGGTTDYIYTRFTLDKSDYGRKFQLSFDQSYAGAGTDFTLAVYSNTASNYAGTSTLLPLQTSTIAALTGPFLTTFDAPNATAPYIEVRVIAAAGTTPLYQNNVYCGPGITVQGAAISEWQTNTQSVAPSGTGGTVNSSGAKWRRVGSLMEVAGYFTMSGAGAGVTTVTIPFPTSGVSLDGTGSPIGVVVADQNPVGYANGYNIAASGAAFSAVLGIRPNSTTTLCFQYAANAITGTNIGSGGQVYYRYSVPISEWSGSGTVSLGAGAQVEYAWNSTATATSGAYTSNKGNGSQGTPLLAYSLTGTNSANYECEFQYPIQSDDTLVLETDTGTGGARWITWESRISAFHTNDAGTTAYGAQLVPQTSTKVSVQFYQNWSALTGASWSSITTWRWRVSKRKSSSPVGFGLAGTDGSSGLYKPGQAPGYTGSSAIAAGYVGQKIEATLTTQGISTTLTDWSGSSLPLTAGTWLILANAQVYAQTNTAANSSVGCEISITDASNNLLGNQKKLFYVFGASVGMEGTLSFASTVTLSSATTYKLRLVKTELNAAVAAQVYNATNNNSEFFAVRIA